MASSSGTSTTTAAKSGSMGGSGGGGSTGPCSHRMAGASGSIFGGWVSVMGVCAWNVRR